MSQAALPASLSALALLLWLLFYFSIPRTVDPHACFEMDVEKRHIYLDDKQFVYHKRAEYNYCRSLNKPTKLEALCVVEKFTRMVACFSGKRHCSHDPVLLCGREPAGPCASRRPDAAVLLGQYTGGLALSEIVTREVDDQRGYPWTV